MKKLIIGAAAAAAMLLMAMPVGAATTEVVTQNNLNGWTTASPVADNRPGGVVNFIVDSAAPLGVGALQLQTDLTNASKAQLMTADYLNTHVSSITTLSYMTKQISGPAVAAPSFQFGIDTDGDVNTPGDKTTLVYEPYWNGSVTPGTWQEWIVSAADGKLWSSRSIPGFVAGGGGPPFYTLEYVKNNFPNAVVTFVGLNVGTYNPGYNVEADKLVVNDVTYNFEPVIRSAHITFPTQGQTVYGTVNFSAYLTDDDIDSIQWAVRQGTCAANTNTVFGNVDDHSDSATINTSDLSNQTFSFTGNMSAMTPGMYCFIYNPVENNGESGIRETVEFNLVAPPPTNKEECKNGGWKNSIEQDFKNQGQCVSFFQANENAKKH